MSQPLEFPEPEMDLDPGRLSPRKNVVRRFYKDLWDKGDLGLIPEMFHDDFTFRGSLGPVLRGHGEFADYVRWLTAALDEYTSDILELIEEGDRISGKCRFHGHQRQSFFGFEPTGRHVWWYGAPIFQFDGPKIRDLWVLGDIYGLVKRLEQADSPIEFRTSS